MTASEVTPSTKTPTDEPGKRNKSKKLIRFASVFLLLGFVCVLLSILVETVQLYQTDNKFLLWLNHFFVSFLSHIGIGLIILAIVTFLLEIPHWMEYFEERLKKIVINKSYLEHLDRDDLLELQSTIMNVYFRNDNIGKSGGFFKYYQTNIQAIIGLPFRENVTLFLNVSVCETNKSLLKISETLSYQCRQNAGRIQDEITYLPEVNEHIETTDFNVSIQHHTLDTVDG